MANIVYIVNEDIPENLPGFEQYSQSDKELITTFEVNSIFDPSKNYAELHIFSLTDELLESVENYTNYTQLGNSNSAGRSGASILTVDPVYDSRIYGYDLGGVKLLYHFLSDAYTVDNATAEFFIESISEDRTEVRILPVTLQDDEIVKFTAEVKNTLQAQSYFDGFRLNFKNNDLFIAVNIDTVDINQGKAVAVKLYEPLPDTYSEKSRLNIVLTVSDSVAYVVDSEITLDPAIQPTIRPANFNLDISEESVVPTGYLSYDDLFSYPVTNANSEIYSMFNEKGIDVSVDFTDYSDFVHFSSAEERLNNFKYKIDLIHNYSSSLSSITATTRGIAGSKKYFDDQISGIISNFDHYERFLYYESGSSSWPKSNTTKPYENIPSIDPTTNQNNPTVAAWYTTQITKAIAFDRSNESALVDAIPSYLKDDDSNVNYLTFIYMIGQHFDNLWTFARAVTDKYDADNRMNHGISKDLVGEALKNFGVKLYTSNKSIEDLFSTIIGQTYQSGSEYITNYVKAFPTGSNTPIQPIGLDSYEKEIQKRIYHNLPLLIKSKGTERGLRALINCFGIPSDILEIKYYGGVNRQSTPFFGDYTHYTSSLDKVRLDNTGSIVVGNTLSGNTSIIKRDSKYTDDLHDVEVGFSPTDNVDRYIISQSAATFDIDQYIGDPRDLSTNSYSGLFTQAEGILANLDRYDLQDYVRLIKFFDNVIFKMIKDFVPARVVADTGIIIKPNLLNRSKAKSVLVEVTRPEYTGSVDTAFIESGDGGVYYSGSTETITGYNRKVTTPQGTSWKQDHKQEEARYDGELYNSGITLTNGELGKNNPYLSPIYPTIYYDVNIFYQAPTGVCIISERLPGFATPNTSVNLNNYFNNTTSTTQFKVGSSAANLTIVSNPSSYTFTGGTGQVYIIQVTDPASVTSCTFTNTVTLQTCTITLKDINPELVQPGQVITFANYINDPENLNDIEYYINDTRINAATYTIPTNAVSANQLTIILKVKSKNGSCIQTKQFNVSTITTEIQSIAEYVTTAEIVMTITSTTGNVPINETGVCWSTSPNPTISDSTQVSTASVNGIIKVYPFPLLPSTTYYVRSYIRTSQGTVYSAQYDVTTLELGTTTTTLLTADTTNLTFQTIATNPAQLPLKTTPVRVSGGGFQVSVYQNLPTVNITFTSTAKLGAVGNIAKAVQGPSTDVIFGTTQLVPIIDRQLGAPYVFRGKATYIQGASNHDLEILSDPVSYTIPIPTPATTFAGGKIFNIKKFGDSGYDGTTTALIAYNSDYAGTYAPYEDGMVLGNNAPAAGANPPGEAATNYDDWRLPSLVELQTLYGTPSRSSFGLTTDYYWSSNTQPPTYSTGNYTPRYVVRFNTSPYSTVDADTATLPQTLYREKVRSVRNYSNSSI